jgi:hypothetical protein
MSDLGVQPIPVEFVDDFAEKLSPLADTPLPERNAYANGVLTWAEGEGEEPFTRHPEVIFGTELARHGKAWHRDDPDVSTDLAIARIEGLLGCDGIRHQGPEGERGLPAVLRTGHSGHRGGHLHAPPGGR